MKGEGSLLLQVFLTAVIIVLSPDAPLLQQLFFLVAITMQPPKKRERISALKSVSGPHNAHSSTINCNSSWTAPIEQPVLVTYMSQELLLPLMSWQWSYVSFQSSPHSENSALKMSQNSQSVEYLLYPTQPSEMYGLGPYLDIKNSTSRITWHWTVCSSLTLSCHIPFEELTSLYIPDL